MHLVVSYVFFLLLSLFALVICAMMAAMVNYLKKIEIMHQHKNDHCKNYSLSVWNVVER